MKYYIEEETVDLKAALDQNVLSWEGVEEKKMMGCPSYLVGRKMFALVVMGGVVITKLDDGQREALTKIHLWEQFKAHRTIKKWAHLILAADELEGVLPFIKHSYNSALDESRKS